MKNYLKSLIVFLLVFVLAFAFVSCNFGNEPTPEPGPEQPIDPPEDDDHENDYRLRFVYSYTALVTNDNNREDYKDEIVTVDSLYISKDNNGITADLIAQINNFTYNGYTFVDWYSEADWDVDTQSGAEGKAIDFAKYGKITSDVTFYGDRGDLAGANAKWSVAFTGENGVVIDVATVDSGKYPDGTTFKSSDVKAGVITISGSGAMFNFQNANAVDLPWFNYRKMVTKIVFEDGITTVGNNAFGEFTNLKEVVFNDDITTIGISAFSGCNNRGWRVLKTPDSLRTIGNGAFTNANFKEVVLNDGLQVVGDNAFYGATSINTIIVPKSLTSIGIAAFNPGSSTGATIDKVYYKGTPDDYNNLVVSMDNAWFNEFPVTYFYTDDATVGNSGYVLEDGSTKPCWHYAEVNGTVTTTPVQYCYTISYRLPGEKLPFTAHYIPVTPKIGADGKIEVDADEIPKLEGVITEEIVKARQELTYHNMTFVGFTKVGTAPETLEVGDAITADIMYDVNRGNIISDGGGLIWAFSGETLTISKNPNAPEGASFRMWDLVDALDTGTLWTGSFGSLPKVKKLEIKEGVEYIGRFAFTNLTGITEVILPASLEGIATNAFDGSANLINIYYMGQQVENCEGLVNEDGTTALTGIRASVYGKTDGPVATPGNYWMEIDVDGTTKRLCWILSADETVEGETVVYSNGVLKIGGDSVMVNFEHAEMAPWYGAKDFITSVSFTGNITNIAENVVNGYSAITSISLPPSVHIVPESAFAGTGIVNDYSKYTKGLLVVDGVLIKAAPTVMNKFLVETYNGITVIAGGAFKGCDAIKRIYIATTVQTINNGAFADSEIEYVFFDGNADGWQGISANAGLNEDYSVFFRSDTNPGTDNMHWHKIGNDYAIWGCVHKFGEWTVVKESTCMLQGSQVRCCIYDETHTETEALPLNDNHNLVIKLVAGKPEITPADCEKAATVKYTCTNLSSALKTCSHTEQVELKEGEEGYEAALGHDFQNYVEDTEWNCLTGGTLTGYCARCKNASNTIPDPNRLQREDHSFTEWIFNEDATCIKDGTEYRTCTACYVEEKQTKVDSHLTAAHDFTAEVEDAKYFDKYSANGESATYFKSCKLCALKSPFKFDVLLLPLDNIDNQKLPIGVAFAGSPSGEVDGTTVKAGYRYMTEAVGDAVNNFIRFQQINNGGSYVLNFTLPVTEGVDTYYVQHDFRWGGATNIREGMPLTSKMLDGKGECHNQPVNFYAKENGDLHIGSSSSKVVAPVGEWVTFLYEFTRLEDGKWNLILYVNGEVAVNTKTTRAVDGTAPSFKYEPRYPGTNLNYNNMIIDFDNMLSYAEITRDNVEFTCPDGEHEMGDWIDDGKQDCLNFGTLYRVCLVDGCNAVESSTDLNNDGELDLPVLGHKWVEDGEEGDGYVLVAPDCTTDGYYTRTCLRCEFVETTTDLNGDDEFDDELKALGHVYVEEGAEGDGYTVVDATCTEDGYYTATCIVCGYVDNVYDKDGNGENDLPALGHKYIEDGAEGDGYTVVDATCTEDGYHTATCIVCGYVNNVYDKDGDGENDLPASGHKYYEEGDETLGYVKTDATCTEDGYYQRTCLVCGFVEEPVYDKDGNGENDLPAAHTFGEYVPDDNSTCTALGTMTRTCTVCGATDTVENPDDAMDPHTVEAYYENTPADCYNNATEIGYCTVCGNVVIRDIEGTKLTHKFGPYETIEGSATCQHGDKTVHVCRLCGYEEGNLPEEGKVDHSLVKVLDDKYFAGYSEDLTKVSYYMVCEWCEIKSHITYSEVILSPVVNDLSDGKLPSYITPPVALNNGASVPTNEGAYAGIVNNEWYAYGKNVRGGEIFTYFALKGTEGLTEIFEFDFKFDGATPVEGMKGQWFGIVKFYSNGATETITNRQMNFGDFNSQKLNWSGMGGNIYNCGEWHTIRFEFAHKDGVTTLITTIDGNEISTVKSTAGIVKRFAVHTRGASYYTDVHFGMKNFSYLTIDPSAFNLKNVVCEGEHNFGEWIYNKDGNCVTDGTHTRICQNGTCNYTETELDPDHLASGEHTLTDWIYNGDRTCVTPGTLTQTCTGCGISETVVDEVNYPALGHSYGDPVAEPGTATCQHGTILRSVCANGCGIDVITYADDKSAEHSIVELAKPEFFAGYANATTAKYYKTCEWCGEKLLDTFNVSVASLTTFDDGVIPSYFASAVEGTTRWMTVTSETVNDALNYYLSIGKKGSTNTNASSWTVTPDANGNKTVVSFDFRWMGVTNVRMSDGNQPIIFKIFEGSAMKANESFILPEGVLDGSQVNIHNVIFNTGDWHNITYEFTRSANGATKVDCLIDGVVTKTFNFTSTSTLTIRYETRYGGSTHANTVYPGTAADGTSNGFVDLEFHLDNMTIFTQTLAVKNCADGNHSFGTYVFYKEADCDTPGTSIALCQNPGCTEVDIKENAELYPAKGHTFGDYVVVPDSATCVKGTASKAICSICSVEDIIYGDDLAECVMGQNAIPSALKSPADYANAAVYVESCNVCGKLGTVEFVYGEALVDNFANGEMLYGLASGNYTKTQPTTAPYMYEMIMSETVGEAVNYYLHVEKVNKVSQNFIYFGDGKEVEGATTYVYQFDMRWGGATNRRDAVVGFVKAVYKGADGKWVELKPLGSEGSSTSWSVSLNANTDNGPLNVANKSIGAMAVGEWVTMRYELTQNADKSWTISVYVGDNLVQSNATSACETVPVIRYETRYGKNSSTTNCDQSYDIDNVIIYAK